LSHGLTGLHPAKGEIGCGAGPCGVHGHRLDMSGENSVRGLWLAQTERAKFSLQVLSALCKRGVQDIIIACVDGPKGLPPQAIEAVLPRAVVQLCKVRNSLNDVSWKPGRTWQPT
jgi:transposase-like protein